MSFFFLDTIKKKFFFEFNIRKLRVWLIQMKTGDKNSDAKGLIFKNLCVL